MSRQIDIAPTPRRDVIPRAASPRLKPCHPSYFSYPPRLRGPPTTRLVGAYIFRWTFSRFDTRAKLAALVAVLTASLVTCHRRTPSCRARALLFAATSSRPKARREGGAARTGSVEGAALSGLRLAEQLQLVI